MKYEFVDIESCECIGSFEDEYVYDIEVADDSHTFIANDILVHNSLYLSYNQLLKTITGIDSLSTEEKRDIIINLNLKFLDKHNREFIADYYAKRYGKSVHNFELETLNKSGVWQNVKKHYAQVLLWKDKEFFDIDKMKMKVVGLEMNKPSHPKLSRKILNSVIRYMLENGDDKYLIHKLNIDVMDWKKKWEEAPIDDICANISVNGYTKYILDDQSETLKVGNHCPANVKALGNYNRIRNFYHLPGEEYYSGKMKLYEYGPSGHTDYFAYPAMEYPEWGNKYAPINRSVMFQKYVLDPLNRILEPAGLPKVNLDGSIQISLF